MITHDIDLLVGTSMINAYHVSLIFDLGLGIGTWIAGDPVHAFSVYSRYMRTTGRGYSIVIYFDDADTTEEFLTEYAKHSEEAVMVDKWGDTYTMMVPTGYWPGFEGHSCKRIL